MTTKSKTDKAPNAAKTAKKPAKRNYTPWIIAAGLGGAYLLLRNREDSGGGGGGLVPDLGGLVPDLGGLVPDLTGLVPDLTGLAPDLTGLAPNLTGLAPNLTGLAPNLTGLIPSITADKLAAAGTTATSVIGRQYLGMLLSGKRSMVPMLPFKGYTAAQNTALMNIFRSKTGAQLSSQAARRAGVRISSQAARRAGVRISSQAARRAGIRIGGQVARRAGIRIGGQVAARSGLRIAGKLAGRAIPVAGQIMLIGDIGADAIRLLTGWNLPEWIGFSGIASPILGFNPFERR